MLILREGKLYDISYSPALDAFVATASSVVDDVVTCAAAKGITLSTTKLELIERWLAAHFYLQADQAYQSKSTDGASATFQGQTGMGLENTNYGQQAMILDRSGCLRQMNAAGSIQVEWGGKKRSEQIDYVDRD